MSVVKCNVSSSFIKGVGRFEFLPLEIQLACLASLTCLPACRERGGVSGHDQTKSQSCTKVSLCFLVAQLTSLEYWEVEEVISSSIYYWGSWCAARRLTSLTSCSNFLSSPILGAGPSACLHARPFYRRTQLLDWSNPTFATTPNYYQSHHM